MVSVPHCGVHVPPEIAEVLTPGARALPDTDWHVDRLYGFAAGLGASVLTATHSRYVIDLNRPPDGAPLYPGADNTELCPTTTFAREAIYLKGGEPDEATIDHRIGTYWRPYHHALATELDRLRARWGIALLYDAHSIRSRVPRFFEGRLPDFNLGTGGGGAADADLAARLLAVCQKAAGFTSALNGRFQGGYITRAYGSPADGVHAVQLELSQITYMDEDPPFTYLPERAEKVRPVIEALLCAMMGWVAVHCDFAIPTPN